MAQTSLFVCLCVCACVAESEWKSSPARWAPVITGWDSFLIILSNINPVGWCRPSCGLMDNVITARTLSHPHSSTHFTAFYTRFLPLSSPSALALIFLSLSLTTTQLSHSLPLCLCPFSSSPFSTHYFSHSHACSLWKKKKKKRQSGSKRKKSKNVIGLLKMIKSVVGIRKQSNTAQKASLGEKRKERQSKFKSSCCCLWTESYWGGAFLVWTTFMATKGKKTTFVRSHRKLRLEY